MKKLLRMTQIITRFAPSPTGYLHIGSARTALFNWLFAKHHGGKYLLRIEDTDRERSTQDAVRAIIDGLNWMGLTPDEDPIFQFQRANRHAEMALKLLAEGKAYYCYCTQQELEEIREKARLEGRPPKYDGRWRDKDPKDAPKDIKPTLRLRAPIDGETILNDRVQGQVIVSNHQLDDMVLLRGDGTPTYMLSVVVDDFDMGITHVIRGDDHLTNTFRQIQLYNAFNWTYPEFGHIPLIHGPDGAKLSKRHGALGVEAYRDMGILPEAMCNYLLRLGWSHGDDEIISRQKAIEWFDFDGIGKSPSRLDMTKLHHINQHYMKEKTAEDLLHLTEKQFDTKGIKLSSQEKERIKNGIESLKPRAQNLVELAEQADIYRNIRPIKMEDESQQSVITEQKEILAQLSERLKSVVDWSQENIDTKIKEFLTEKGLKLGKIGPSLRLILTGRTSAPGVFEVMFALGKEETLLRLEDYC
jgi:glutamyl-tRNA synthetase